MSEEKQNVSTRKMLSAKTKYFNGDTKYSTKKQAFKAGHRSRDIEVGNLQKQIEGMKKDNDMWLIREKELEAEIERLKLNQKS